MSNLPVTRVPAGAIAIPDVKLEDLISELPAEVQELIGLYPNEWQRALDALAANEDMVLTEAHVELVLIILDDSTSIAEKRNAARAFCQATRAFLKAFQTKNIVNAMVAVWTMNRRDPLRTSTQLSQIRVPDDYPAEGHTPLIETMIAALFYQALLALWYKRVLRKLLGVEAFVGSTTVIFTDGEPSRDTPTPEPVRILADYLQGLSRDPANRARHIIIGVGVGRFGTFRSLFMAMGVYLSNIYTVNNFGKVQGELAAAGLRTVANALESGPQRVFALPGPTAPKPAHRSQTGPRWRPRWPGGR